MPPEIGELVQLESLVLAGHLFTTLPREIGRLTRLRRLELGVRPAGVSARGARAAGVAIELHGLDGT